MSKNDTEGARRLAILIGVGSSGPEQKAAGILKMRILKRSSVVVEIATEGTQEAVDLEEKADLVFVIGSPRGNGRSRSLIEEFGVHLPTLPNSNRAHPEGFAVRSVGLEGRSYVLIAGVDERGTVYGVGHVLRAIAYHADAIDIPSLDACEKPAFWMRGGNPSGPGSRARRYGNLRPQTSEEHREVMEDLMLLGTNIFGGDPGVARSYGMMTTSGRTANEMPRRGGSPGFPREWGADGGRSEKCVCPSIPEARKALLESFEEMFRASPQYDFFTTNSGDTGGCRCERCMPWGGTYIRLVHEIADILHRYQPERKVLATNQDLTSEGNQAILDYLNSRDPTWLFALRYGPGADEMQTYIRGPVNPRWFEYEGFGPLGNYLKHLHHDLPRETGIALYSDITHWMQAQFAVPRPDVALAALYGRRSWNARPRHFVAVAGEIFHYAMGDMHYSEGMHDDFNKWLWYRLLWNPNLSAEEITGEYCRYWLGEEAKDEATEAVFLMEENLERPVRGNPGIRRAVELLRSAGGRIPSNLKRHDYRWRIITQKALMDLYVQLLLERGDAIKSRAAEILGEAQSSMNPGKAVTMALEVLGEPLVTPEMESIRSEAIKLGEESNDVVGYRVPAPFIVEGLDLTEVMWWRKTLIDALETGEEEWIRNVARMVTSYDDPGEGGRYVSFGWPNSSKVLEEGDELWGFMPFRGPARLSHYGVAYSWGAGGRGVKISFHDLDPDAEYVIRISVGVHVEEQELPVDRIRPQEGLEVNGKVISEGFPVPVGETGFVEFDLPKAIAGDGSLTVQLVPKSELLPVTGLSEIWLMPKDNMPWTCRRSG